MLGGTYRGNDHQPVEKVDGYPMRALIFCAPDFRDTSIGSNYQHRCQVALQSTIKPRKALDIQHVNLAQGERIPGTDEDG